MSTLTFEDREEGIPTTAMRNCDAFRAWGRSGAMPDWGRFAFLGDCFWMAVSREDIFRHSRLITEILVGLDRRVTTSRGYLFCGRAYYANPVVGLSTAPDLFFVSTTAIVAGDAGFVRDEEGQVWEVEGTADLTLEIVSKTSARKDFVLLRELYHRAGVREYWLIDPRKSPARFEILRWTPDAYVSVEPADGWLRSEVFSGSFRLDESNDPLGNPSYTLNVQ